MQLPSSPYQRGHFDVASGLKKIPGHADGLSPTRAIQLTPNDFALVGLLGLFGLRISEATRVDIADLGE